MNAVEIKEAVSRLAEVPFDPERLEKLFELYTQMTSRQASSNKPVKRNTKGADA
jgi:acyl-CoA-binding protein